MESWRISEQILEGISEAAQKKVFFFVKFMEESSLVKFLKEYLEVFLKQSLKIIAKWILFEILLKNIIWKYPRGISEATLCENSKVSLGDFLVGIWYLVDFWKYFRKNSSVLDFLGLRSFWINIETIFRRNLRRNLW